MVSNRPSPIPKEQGDLTSAQWLAVRSCWNGHNKKTGQPFFAREWPRRIHREWASGDPGTDLRFDIADMCAQADLLHDRDHAFLRHVELTSIRRQKDGSHAVFLCNTNFCRLLKLTYRFTDPIRAANFLRRATIERHRAAEHARAHPSQEAPTSKHVEWRGDTFYSAHRNDT
jgi:hypothetical protein